jgi:ABC-type nitrate/sulfonate/bicarbonate transport system substrate-binding protein
VALLKRNNLQPGHDVKFLYLGGVREVLAALERGIITAGVLSAPTTLMARRLGLKEVVNIADLKLPYVHSGLVTRRGLIRQSPDRVRTFSGLIWRASRSATRTPRSANARWRAISPPTTRR